MASPPDFQILLFEFKTDLHLTIPVKRSQAKLEGYTVWPQSNPSHSLPSMECRDQKLEIMQTQSASVNQPLIDKR